RAQCPKSSFRRDASLGLPQGTCQGTVFYTDAGSATVPLEPRKKKGPQKPVWLLQNLCGSWLKPRHKPCNFSAALAADVPILQFSDMLFSPSGQLSRSQAHVAGISETGHRIVHHLSLATGFIHR